MKVIKKGERPLEMWERDLVCPYCKTVINLEDGDVFVEVPAGFLSGPSIETHCPVCDKNQRFKVYDENEEGWTSSSRRPSNQSPPHT